jgi:hypothetical protein
MYAHAPEVAAERARRKELGITTLRWYKCHGCGAEYSMASGVRASWGCICASPRIHVHSDLDGEQPKTLSIG